MLVLLFFWHCWLGCLRSFLKVLMVRRPFRSAGALRSVRGCAVPLRRPQPCAWRAQRPVRELICLPITSVL